MRNINLNTNRRFILAVLFFYAAAPRRFWGGGCPRQVHFFCFSKRNEPKKRSPGRASVPDALAWREPNDKAVCLPSCFGALGRDGKTMHPPLAYLVSGWLLGNLGWILYMSSYRRKPVSRALFQVALQLDSGLRRNDESIVVLMYLIVAID